MGGVVEWGEAFVLLPLSKYFRREFEALCEFSSVGNAVAYGVDFVKALDAPFVRVGEGVEDKFDTYIVGRDGDIDGFLYRALDFEERVCKTYLFNATGGHDALVVHVVEFVFDG